MPQVPNRLQPDTPLADNLALINNNADNAVQDIGDLGAKFSTVGTISATVAAGNMFSFSVGVTDDKSPYSVGNLQIVPRVEAWVDNDRNDDYLFEYGGSLSAEQQNALMSVWVARRPNPGNVAQFAVQVKNFGALPHTYYFAVDESYMNSPPVGNFR